MATSLKWYGRAFLSAFNKEIDIDSDSFKVMLCASAYTPDQDNHRYKSDITNEITGTGYTAGGLALTGVAITYTGGTNVIAIDANDAVWTGATFTARYAVVYDATPATDTARPLLGYLDFGADVPSAGGPFTISWDPSGMVTVTVG